MNKLTYYDHLYGKLFKATLSDLKRAENVGFALARNGADASQVLKGMYGELKIDPPNEPKWYDDFKDGLPFSTLQVFETFDEE